MFDLPIEQSIYTCALARKETGTTGFGIFSETKGMQNLIDSSRELNNLNSNYSAPRNQELWWQTDISDEKERDRVEAEMIREHHPVTFSFRCLNIEGIEKAVFTYGKNIGRDIAGIRPGNIMVSTVVSDISQIESYPFSYYGSKELFPEYDRSFFINAGENPVDDLPNYACLTQGDIISVKKVQNFINEKSERSDILLSMFQYLLDYNDKDYPDKQLMICDKKDNIIMWIAALSLIFPKEIAKKISFSTYSFLGESDVSHPVYENTMICGLYSPALNGDPADDSTTNYDFSAESSNEKTALYDFEKNYFIEADDRFGSFKMLIETSIKSNIQSLEKFHDFILNSTSYRNIDNDYARAYACFVIWTFPSERSLNNLDEAGIFASKYMEKNFLADMLEKIFSVTVGLGKKSSKFEIVLKFAEHCMEKNAVSSDFVIEKYSFLIKEKLTSEDIGREEFFDFKDKISNMFKKFDIDFEASLTDIIGLGVFQNIYRTSNKKWILLLITELLCRKIAFEGAEGLYSNSEESVLFKSVFKKILLSEENKRSELMAAYADIFLDINSKFVFADVLYNEISDSESDQKYLESSALLVDKNLI